MNTIVKNGAKIAAGLTALGLAACANDTPPPNRYVQNLVQRDLDGHDKIVGWSDDRFLFGNTTTVVNLKNADGQIYQVATTGPNAAESSAKFLLGIGSVEFGGGTILNGIGAIRQAGQTQAPQNEFVVQGGNSSGQTSVQSNKQTASPTLSSLQQANPTLNSTLTANPQFSAMLQANPQITSNLSSYLQANPTITQSQLTSVLQRTSQMNSNSDWNQNNNNQQQQQQPSKPSGGGGKGDDCGCTGGQGGWMGSSLLPRDLDLSIRNASGQIVGRVVINESVPYRARLRAPERSPVVV